MRTRDGLKSVVQPTLDEHRLSTLNAVQSYWDTYRGFVHVEPKTKQAISEWEESLQRARDGLFSLLCDTAKLRSLWPEIADFVAEVLRHSSSGRPSKRDKTIIVDRALTQLQAEAALAKRLGEI